MIRLKSHLGSRLALGLSVKAAKPRFTHLISNMSPSQVQSSDMPIRFGPFEVTGQAS